MAKRPRPRKRGKNGAEEPGKLEQAAVAELEKHTPKDEPQDEDAPANEGTPAHDDAPPADAPSTAPPPASEAPADTHEADKDGDSSDDEHKPQKKRKRTRKRRKEAKAGPDPASIPGLGESAQRAIAYAQTYFRDRAAWKFSKPRQNWLMRHILWSEPIFHAAKEIAAVPEDTRVTLPAELQTCIEPALQLPEEGAWIPEEHVSVVAVYLQSIMGLAKQRMLDTLQASAAASVPAAPAPRAAVAPAPTAAAEEGEARDELAARDAAGGEEGAQPDTDASSTDVYALAQTWNALRTARAAATLGWIEAREAT